MSKPKIPKVRIARPDGRPYQLRYTDPETKREVRISTGTRDEDEAEDQKEKFEAKAKQRHQLGMKLLRR